MICMISLDYAVRWAKLCQTQEYNPKWLSLFIQSRMQKNLPDQKRDWFTIHECNFRMKNRNRQKSQQLLHQCKKNLKTRRGPEVQVLCVAAVCPTLNKCVYARLRVELDQISGKNRHSYQLLSVFGFGKPKGPQAYAIRISSI